MKTSEKGLNLIASYEGLELTAYYCPARVLTIGYGHTKTVKRGQVITKAQALELLKQDVAAFENTVNKLVKVTLNQNQFDALVSLVFNIGAGNFAKSSVLRFTNARNFMQAANAFTLWNKARVNGKLTVLKGLTNRRKTERLLFLSNA